VGRGGRTPGCPQPCRSNLITILPLVPRPIAEKGPNFPHLAWKSFEYDCTSLSHFEVHFCPFKHLSAYDMSFSSHKGENRMRGLLQAVHLKDHAVESLRSSGSWTRLHDEVSLGCSLLFANNFILDMKLNNFGPEANSNWGYCPPACWHPGDQSWQLDIWCGPKVLNIEWAGSRAYLKNFKRGVWEATLFKLSARELVPSVHRLFDPTLKRR
jgi:hypothetical protein